ncbi:MAG: secretin N-terminal domain-containing protein, partial [Bdellovibrionota bacterium]|nr:secretin N-terminal domain-containing protein [Bdellovibrionota bacterium]
MYMKNSLAVLICLSLLGCSSASSQDEGLASNADEIVAETDFSGEDFGDFEESAEEGSEEDFFAESESEELSSGENFTEDDFSEEDFNEDDFSEDDIANSEEDFSEDDFSEEDFSEEDMVFSEDDLEGEDFAEGEADDFFAEEESFDEMEMEAEPSVELADQNISEPTIEETPVVETPIVASGDNRIVGLDFLANKNGGTILISSLRPVQFRQRKNLSTGQHIVEVEGVQLPEKFQRPYDTREFNGSIGLFQAYQEKGSNVARFVLQTKSNSEPLITQEGEALLILAQNPVQEYQMAEAPDEGEIDFDNNRITVDTEAIRRDEEVLKDKSIEDFLTGNTNYYGKKINIELVNTNIIEVFNILAEQSNLNIIVAEGVSGTITLRLREIPWDQALMVVLQSKQLGYVKNGNILRIAPLKTIEKEANDARAVIEAQKKLLPVKVRIYPVSFAQASDISSQVQDFLTPDRGKVKADTRTNSIIVTDLPEVLEKVGKLIKRLDTETPQVLMEAKFVETTEDFDRQVNLGLGTGSYTSESGNSYSYTGLTGNGNGGLNMTFNSVSSLGSIGAFLDLYEKKNLARVISSPRVIGLNNESATISQTTQVLDKTTTTSTDGGTSSTSFTPRDLTLNLTMTPQITADGGVLM